LKQLFRAVDPGFRHVTMKRYLAIAAKNPVEKIRTVARQPGDAVEGQVFSEMAVDIMADFLDDLLVGVRQFHLAPIAGGFEKHGSDDRFQKGPLQKRPGL